MSGNFLKTYSKLCEKSLETFWKRTQIFLKKSGNFTNMTLKFFEKKSGNFLKTTWKYFEKMSGNFLKTT